MMFPIHGLEMPAQVLVTGASSGIGLAMVQALLDDAGVARVCAVSRHPDESADLQALRARHGERAVLVGADITTDAGLEVIARAAASDDGLHLVVNCAGLLHDDGLRPEKSLATLDRETLRRVFEINAFAPVLLAKALLPLLGPGAPRVFASLSARVGSIGDNKLGGWYAYRASKAAQNQLLRTLAIEWRRTHPHATCVLLHPGTVDTPLSRPFQANVAPEALFPPGQAARQLLDIIARVTPADSGNFIAWDGSPVPW